MSERRSLPADSFEYYVSLGDGRSYQAVADHFGVSKRAVAKKAASEDWQDRLSKLEREARNNADSKAAGALEAIQTQHLNHVGELQEAVRLVMTPKRMQALVAAVFKEAVKKGDVQAARLLIERVLGKPRSEPLPAVALDVPDGLDTAAAVRKAANAILQSVADGSLAPEDAQKLATVVESVRRTIETEELEQRISELEEHTKREGRP